MGIDAAYGIGSLKQGVCTSSTRPASPFEGQQIYETDTDVLAIWNGSAWRYIAATTPTNGTVLQVVSTTKVDTFSTTSTGSFVDVTGLSVSITPKSSSSKVFVTFHISNGNAGANHNMYNLLRNSTNLAQPSADAYSSTAGSSHIGGDQDFKTVSFSHLDSPSSTSSITYKIQAKTSGATLYVNRRGDVASVCAASSITVMEIAG
jgi:hypothetical protein